MTCRNLVEESFLNESIVKRLALDRGHVSVLTIVLCSLNKYFRASMWILLTVVLQSCRAN